MLDFYCKSFSELTTTELYAILELRSEIFVVEQDCVYQDVDSKDQKALHLFGIKNENLIAYTRVFKPGAYFKNASIGRVAVKKKERKFGYGHDLLSYAINIIHSTLNESVIKLSAQTYLKKFYESHGFEKIGSDYLEDGIPHIAMIKK